MSHRFLLHFLVNSLIFAALSACSNDGDRAAKSTEGGGGTAGIGGHSEGETAGSVGHSEGGTTNAGGAHSSISGGTNAHSSTTTCEKTLKDLCTGASDNLVRCKAYTEAESNANFEKCTTRNANVPFSCQYLTAFTECVSTIDCSESADSCIFRGILAAKPAGWDVNILDQCLKKTVTDESVCLAAYGEPTRKCLTKYEACGGAESSPYHDDACITLGALTDEAARLAVDCLSLDCSAASTCLKSVGAFSY